MPVYMASSPFVLSSWAGWAVGLTFLIVCLVGMWLGPDDDDYEADLSKGRKS